LHNHGNFEEPNKGMDSSITTINYCIIINAYYNYNSIIIHDKLLYKIANEDLLKEYKEEEKVEVTGVAAASCVRRRL
jgi:hypothetical protein